MSSESFLRPVLRGIGVPRGTEEVIHPGRHSEGGRQKRKKGKEKKKKKGKEGKNKKGEKKKKKIWEKHVITVKLNWNILAEAPLCTYKV